MRVLTVIPYPETTYKTIRLNHNFTVKVDLIFFDAINRYHWFAKKSFNQWYACRWTIVADKRKLIRMHRVIALTPIDQVCHHINGDTMDNRLDNLLNLTEFEHAKYFSYR